MKKSIFDKRMPTGLALFILLAGLVVTSILIRQGIFTVSQASPEQEPQNVEIVNVTDTSFSVAFTTNAPTVAAINIQNTNPPTLAYDKRDTSGKTASLTHFITVNSLSPNSPYNFSLLSNGKNYLDNGQLYSVTTSPTTDTASDTYPLAGSIILPDGTPGVDTLILVKIPDAQTIGAVTDPQGNYRISANNIRDLKTHNVMSLAPQAPIEIIAIQKNAKSQVTYNYIPGVTIPPITLSNNYSFIASDEETQVGTAEASLLSIPTSTQKNTGLSIIQPKANQTFIDQRPQFRGTATPNTTVRLIITSEKNIDAVIKSDAQGNWTFRPSASIAPGTRTLTVSQTQPSLQKSVSFQVFASGSQIAESATPSASLTPTTTVTPSVTRIPSQSISPTGATTTTTPSPTAVIITPITVFITNTPTPVPVVITSTQQKPLPPTGSSATTVILTTLSVIFIVTGSAFLLML